MKILWIVDDYSGGAGNAAQLLTRELSKRGYDVTLLLTSKHTTPKYDLHNVSEMCFDLDRNRSEGFPRWFKRVKKELGEYITRSNYDVVVSFLDVINTTVAFAMMHTKQPLIVCERSNPLEIFPRFPWNIMRYPAYARANCVSVQFESFTKMSHGVFKNKTVVFPNPIVKPDVQHYCTDEKKKTFRLISAARLEPVKQFPLMIDIFSELHKKRSETELTILGDGTQHAALQEKISRLGLNDCVHLPGSKKHVNEILVEYDAYLMTSKQEGFPNSLCEAMAVGLPCVAFECHTGLRELIHNGQNGFLVSPGENEVMVDRIEQLIDNEQLRKSMGDCALKISDEFSMDKVITIWENEFDRLMAQKHASESGKA